MDGIRTLATTLVTRHGDWQLRTRRTGIRVLQATALGLGAALSIAGAGLLWLSQESARPLDRYWHERLGTVVEIRQERELLGNGLHADRITIYSDTGLRAGFQVLRKDTAPGRSPVLVILGGQETGAEAIHLFEQSGPKAVIAIDYPYDGSREFRGIMGFFRNLPAMRSACRDTPASVSLVLDWLAGQEWVDPDRIVLAGVSFGVPFAAAAAATDGRVSGLILAHGAADNRAWAIATASRHLPTFLAAPAGTLVNWLGYGPAYDTAAYVRRLSPRPILIVGAREDERTPSGQTELLYEAAAPNRLLRWTDGRHVQVSRRDVVDQLMGILEREMPFLTGDGGPG